MADPVSGQAMSAVAFYPATTPSKTTQTGPYTVDAAANVPIAPGKFPLIVYSHGAASTPWIAHDLASYLARHGFIFAAVTHPGDNLGDHSATTTDRSFIGRGYQISALIDHVLASDDLGPHADAGRIGAAGYSAGAYTALVLGGAKPNFALQQPYCKRHPDDSLLCSGWKVGLSTPPLEARRDTRIRAIFAEAPFGVFFDAASLRDVKAPIDIWAAGDDHILQAADNFDRIRDFLPGTPVFNVIPHADHFVFVAPCSAALARQAAPYCTDAPGVDRAAIHERIEENALSFFQQNLK